MHHAATVEVLRDWLNWALEEGSDLAEELGYAPLSDELKALALEKIDSITTF